MTTNLTLYRYQEEAVTELVDGVEEALNSRRPFVGEMFEYVTLFKRDEDGKPDVDSEFRPKAGWVSPFPDAPEDCDHQYLAESDGDGNSLTDWARAGCPFHTEGRSIVTSTGKRLIVSDEAMLLHAPTGSGKTVMLYEMMRRLTERRALTDRGVMFVFIAPNRLHEQALRSFQTRFGWQGALIDLDDIASPQADGFHAGDILFMNYAGSNKETNRAIREDERGVDLTSVMEATREHTDVVLVVDEAHNAAGTAKSQELFLRILPDVTVNATATPVLRSGEWVSGKRVQVMRSDVVEAGQVVDDIRFNDDYETLVEGIPAHAHTDANAPYVWAAVKQRDILADAYNAAGSEVKPLLGIQIPSKVNSKGEYVANEFKKDDGEELELTDSMIQFLETQFGWTVEGGQVAVWLANRKENLDGIEDNASNVRAIIFKTAIATGWDCPRLKVLALLRDNKSAPFSTQTVGRAMRQPERIRYDEDMLNHAYAYTSFDSIETDLRTIELARQSGDDIQVTVQEYPLLKRYADEYRKTVVFPNYSEKWLATAAISSSTVVNKFRKNIITFTGKDNYPAALEASSPKTLMTERFGFVWSLATQGYHLSGADDDIDDGDIGGIAVQSHALTPAQVERVFEERIADAVKSVDGASALVPHIRWAFAVMVQDIRKRYPSFTETLFAQVLLSKANRKGFNTFVRSITESLIEDGVGQVKKEHVQHGDYLLPKFQRRAMLADLVASGAWDKVAKWYMYGVTTEDEVGFPPQNRSDRLDSEGEEVFQRDLIPNIFNYLTKEVDGQAGAEKESFGFFKSGTQNRLDLAFPYVDKKTPRLFYPDWLIVYKMDGVTRVLIVETKREKLTSTTNAKAQALRDWCRENTSEDLIIDGTVLNIPKRGKVTDARDVATTLVLDDFLKEIREMD